MYNPNLPRLTMMGHHRTWLYVVAGLSVMAGIIHVVAIPEHFEEWVGYGLFFLVAAVAQLLYPFILLTEGPNRALVLAGILGNGFIIGLYILTRTAGIPFGPEAGEVEPIQALDALSKVAELALILCLLLLRRTSSPPVQTAGR